MTKTQRAQVVELLRDASDSHWYLRPLPTLSQHEARARCAALYNARLHKHDEGEGR